jgi:hypothetical protein
MDALTRQSFEHRRQWIVDRIKQLTDIFAIGLCSNSVMSNHFHIILHADTDRTKALSEKEVNVRWECLFSLPMIVQRYLANEVSSQAERDTVSELLSKWRSRFYDISWFMHCINEPIARQANKEDDGCTGRFWGVSHTLTCKVSDAVLKMRDGPLVPLFRQRRQTVHYCFV